MLFLLVAKLNVVLIVWKSHVEIFIFFWLHSFYHFFILDRLLQVFLPFLVYFIKIIVMNLLLGFFLDLLYHLGLLLYLVLIQLLNIPNVEDAEIIRSVLLHHDKEFCCLLTC